MGKLLLERFTTPEQVANAAADKWLERIVKAGSSRQIVALSGGRISRVFFAAVAERVKKRSISLDALHFFWADERCVPPNHDDSNYLLAYDQLLGPAQVADSNMHRVRGEEPPEAAIRTVTDELLKVAVLNSSATPVFDVIFLGMGEDGHVASLFTPPTPETDSGIYVHVQSPKPPPDRITLTYPVIEAAKEVWVLASGAGKEIALCDSLSPDGKTPLAHVIRRRPLTRILTNI